MTDDPIDEGDSNSRNELRKYRLNFGRADPFKKPESLYLSRWIPNRSHISTPWDGFVAVLGAIMLVAIIVGIIVAHFW
jgi:hypothetical protein